jgi:hypothetical protein
VWPGHHPYCWIASHRFSRECSIVDALYIVSTVCKRNLDKLLKGKVRKSCTSCSHSAGTISLMEEKGSSAVNILQTECPVLESDHI